MTIKAEYFEADQDWANETTRYWFSLTGEDEGTGVVFDNDEFAILESGGQITGYLDADGCPLTEGNPDYIAVRKSIRLTDEIRKQASGL